MNFSLILVSGLISKFGGQFEIAFPSLGGAAALSPLPLFVGLPIFATIAIARGLNRSAISGITAPVRNEYLLDILFISLGYATFIFAISIQALWTSSLVFDESFRNAAGYWGLHLLAFAFLKRRFHIVPVVIYVLVVPLFARNERGGIEDWGWLMMPSNGFTSWFWPAVFVTTAVFCSLAKYVLKIREPFFS